MDGSNLKPMDSEQFRDHAHRMVDFIADYYQSIESFPVLSQVEPGYLNKLLPDSAPIHPESLENVLDDVQTKILPGVTHWQSPNYYAYYPSNSSIAGFLGEMLSGGLNIVGFSWITSPAATELEMIVLDWLAKLLMLPEAFLSAGQGGGVIQGTASEAVLVVLLAARDKALRKNGKNSLDKLVIYASDQTHSALQKACQIGGIHPENCRLLQTDSSTNYALSPDALSEAVMHDTTIGLVPFFLCATVGTTSSTAVDPLPALGKIAKDYEMWFHVDAAYAGSACICPEYRHFIDGVEEADSFNMNAHKWFLTNFDCSALWIKDRNALAQSLSTNPEYLKNKASQAKKVMDYKDLQIPLGRRFRSLKLWMVLRMYGVENLQSYIKTHIKLAQKFETFVTLDTRFEIVAPRNFSLVCFRLLPMPNGKKTGNELNQELLEVVNSTGKIFISHTVLSGTYILRFAVGAPLTEERHVIAAWKVLQDEASSLLATLAANANGRRIAEKTKTKTKTMDAEQLREQAHKMADFIADYYKNIENYPVLSQVQPGYLAKLIPDSAPDHPESLDSVLDDVETKILKGLTHWQSPSFFGYFPINSSIASFLGEMLTSGLNVMSFSWVASPAATELEIIVLDWLAKLLHLPPHFLSSGEGGGGVIQGTACESVLTVIVAARDRTLRKFGRNSFDKLVVYASDQTHSSFQKGCTIGGINPENCRLLPADSSTDYALSPDVLSEAISKDIANGLIPFFLCATVATTSSTAVDPLPALGKIAKRHGMWFHVDAAYGGSACICPEFRHYLDGVEEADSFNMNAHKWLLTNFDCSPLWIKDKSAIVEAISIHPEYLQNNVSRTNAVVDFKDLQIPLARRFRSLKLWMVMRMYGVERLQAYIRNHVNLAQHLEKLILQDTRFEIVAPRKFALLCFRLLPPPGNEELGNKLNSQLLNAVNLTGKIYITHSVLSGKHILRLVIGAPLTEERHVNAAWKVLQEEASSLLAPV